ncbi:acetate--CoA ligase family protein [Sinimarinibacterium thermocellulolyticum]|uniref:Acetate--CoA ligase family protein n=1 Tax=Sinimarinibacterium thermocellulolyticum TaxID=3170016 RepID=A0ABV2AEF1_9GAMM
MTELSTTTVVRSSLDRLFNPRSIALVGATERSIWSVAAVDNLKRFDFDGPVHLVNPKGGTIFGRPAFTSCTAIGQPVDAALLMVPVQAMPEVFADLRAAGVGGAVILSAGFAETGEEGAERQHRLAEIGREAGIRIIGPNCLGFANFSSRTAIWTTPLRRPMPGGNVAIVSQSGALASQLEQFAYQQRVGLTHMISTGNEADVTVADTIAYLAAQPEPRAIALFLESVRQPQAFRDAVRAANDAGKAIVVLKVGTSEATAKAAQAHTGSLVGNDRVFDALCRELKMARVHSLEELIVTADVLGRIRLPGAGSGLALIAMSGGICEIATDQAEDDGVPLAKLSETTIARLRDVLPPMARPTNPLDLTGAAMLEPELIVRAVDVISADDHVGAVGFVFDAPLKADERGFAQRFISQVGAGFQRTSKPCLMMSHTFTGVSGEARSMTDQLGAPYSGGGVRHCLSALGHAFRRARRPSRSPRCAPDRVTARPRSEREVLDHLAAHGVPVIPAKVVVDAAGAVAAARAMQTAVVLKIASPDIPHKTEVGGVALNLCGDEAVAAAFDTMLEKVRRRRPDARIDGVIVSPMRDRGVELFVGTLRDPQWGPAITIGLGGIFVEALKDTSLRLLPVTPGDVREMFDELRGKALLDGFRGAPAVDRDVAARVVAAIGDAALALGPDLVSLEVNPLLAIGAQVEALDGVAIWADDHE